MPGRNTLPNFVPARVATTTASPHAPGHPRGNDIIRQGAVKPWVGMKSPTSKPGPVFVSRG
jgi:hypothetical protein